MMFSKRVWLVWSGLVLSQLSFAAPALTLPAPEVEVLPNGLQIIWFVKDALPIVDISMFVKAGYRDDPAGKSGTLELLSALLDRGSTGASAQTLAKRVESLGASHFVLPEDDSLGIGLHGLSPDANELMEVLGKYVLEPEFPPEEVNREHARILDRWNHIEDYSEVLAQIAYQRVITAKTSYGRGSLISAQEFHQVHRTDVVEFHKKYFTPQNSLLLVVGRVDKTEFKKKILSVFGPWKGVEPKHEWKNYTDSRIALNQAKILVVDRPELNQAQVRMGFRAPLLTSPEHFHLIVGNALLGDYFNSRLNALIRDKLGLTYSINSSFGFKKEFAEWTIASATRTETVGKLVSQTIEVLRTLKKGPVAAEEVDTAKTYLQGGFPLSTATLNAVASRWLTAYVYGLNSDYLNQFMEKIEQVQQNEVQTTLVRNLDVDHLVIVIAGDAKKILPSLKAEKLGSVKKVSISAIH